MSYNANGAGGERDFAPLVTIALPVFNAGRHLRPTVISILRQTFTNWELLIIDDGSSDGAVDSILDLNDARIRILRDGLNRGLATRLNEAIDLAHGSYFARMDSDDISYPERLAQQVAALEATRQLDLVAVRCVAINNDNDLVGALPFHLLHKDICATPWKGFYMAHPSWMGRIEWFRRHRYATPGPYFCEDQELLLRSYLESRFATIPEILFAYRVRSAIAWGKTFKTRETIWRIQLHYFYLRRQWHYCLLATITFMARITADASNVFIQILGTTGVQRYRVASIPSSERSRWQAVQATLISP